jgi:hypothetical protein
LKNVKRLALIAVLVASLAAGCGKKGSPTTTVTAIGQQKPTAQETSPGALKSLSGQLGHPIYWIGQESGKKYELTQTSDGRIFVRYLPPDVEIGSTEARFTIVGTYPVKNAYDVLKKLGKRSGERSFTAPHHGLAVFDSSRPTNIYLAYPDSSLQIEIFDPSPDRARKLITTGKVEPVS